MYNYHLAMYIISPHCCTVILKVEVVTLNHLLADQANSEPMLHCKK